MASCRRIKTLPDLISQLPEEVKERVLEFLPTREVAKTALLSTQWRDAWLGHGQLLLDLDFFSCRGDNASLVKTITNILLHRARPFKKFFIDMLSFKLDHNDLDNWFLYLSRNGIEELHISMYDWTHKYKLPSCIVSCPTIKLLKISGSLVFVCPCIFPGITSLVLNNVEFNDNVNGIVYSVPNLEKLAIDDCEGVNNFEINAPKLKILSAGGYSNAVRSGWFMRHLKAINSLCLDATLFMCENSEVATVTFPTAINLQVINLYEGAHLCHAIA